MEFPDGAWDGKMQRKREQLMTGLNFWAALASLGGADSEQTKLV